MSNLPFRLISITDRNAAGDKLIGKVKTISESGVKCVMVREKGMNDRDLLALSRKIKSVIDPRTNLIINDRADIAFLSNADGVHSPGNGFSSEDIHIFNPKFITGKSVHSLDELKKAYDDGFNYVIYGPVFKTMSKKYSKPAGIEKLVEICQQSHLPVFAVGGINPENANKCIEAGAYGIAVISVLMNCDNIHKTVNEFKEVFGGVL